MFDNLKNLCTFFDVVRNRIDLECTKENEAQVWKALEAIQYGVQYRNISKNGIVSMRAI